MDRKAWLTRKSGPLAGTRHPIRGAVTRVGRDPGSDVVIEGEEAAVVSSRHLELRVEGDSYRLYDLNSTNGTYVDGQRVADATLPENCTIRLGSAGPQLTFEVEAAPAAELAKTVVLPAPPVVTPSAQEESAKPAISKEHDEVLSKAVRQARMARGSGVGGQTTVIMREMLDTVIRRSGRKLKVTIGALLVALIGVSGYAIWKIQDLKKEKSDIDAQIRQIEVRLEKGGQDPAEIDGLIDRLNAYQDQARSLQNNLLYQLGARSRETIFVESEIKTLMAEFGAEQYSIPPDFVEQVNRFIKQYQGPDRPNVERTLGRARKDLETIRRLFLKEQLPPDLGYMVLVESAFISENSSTAGAVGLWQFTPATARSYGMKVNDNLDERLDLKKSTLAACRYIRELILDFGAGSSVMLALAAYNLGPGKVKRAVRTVKDPIKQRNFWYLYRVRALPEETREYVPKIIAAIIIGRHPERFGF